MEKDDKLNEAKIRTLKSQKSYYSTAKTQIEDAIEKYEKIHEKFTDSSKFTSERIKKINIKLENSLSELKKYKTKVNNAIDSVDAKINSLKK